MKLSALKIDVARMEQGDWIDALPGLPGVAFKVRGAGNADWKAMQAKLVDAIPFNERRSQTDADKAKLFATLVVETALIDWRGLMDDDGKEVPFSKGLALTLMGDPAFIRFQEAVSFAMAQVVELRAEDTADAAKN